MTEGRGLLVDWPAAKTPLSISPNSPLTEREQLANLQLFARSIAHDFNNLISGILGHALLIEDLQPVDPDIAESAGIIRKTAERAAELNAQLSDLARMGAAKAQPVDLHQTLRDVADLLGPSLGRSICAELDLRAPHSVVTGDAGQLHQVFLNLAINARDAMPRGGRLVFATESNAGTVSVRVADTGQGIPASLHQRIFEPLFTTKGEGKGTGLGLAVVKRVVESHAGLVELQSAPGQGSAFTLRFPLREVAEAATAAGLKALSAVAGA